MSLKPDKKSDLNKEWMKKRRDKPIRIQPEYQLIVTEGTSTEPQYFRAIRDIINQQYRGRVQLDIYGEGQNTLSLFDRARSHVQRSSNVYNMFGLCMIRMTFHKIILTGRQNCVHKAARKKQSIMQSGQTSALRCGFSCILAIFSRIFTEKSIGQNLVKS